MGSYRSYKSGATGLKLKTQTPEKIISPRPDELYLAIILLGIPESPKTSLGV